jgi:MFS family permease
LLGKEVRDSFRDILGLMRGNFLAVTLCSSWVTCWMRIFYPYESVYLQSLGASSLIIGSYFAANGLIGAIARIPGGYLCDTYGRRKMIVVGNYLTAIVWVFIALASRWQSYFIAQISLSVVSFWTVAEQTILVDSMMVEKRGFGFSVFRTITQLAGLASPYVGGWILESHQDGLRLVLLLIGVAAGIRAVVYTRFLEETLASRRKKQSLTFHSLVDPFIETLKTLKWMSRPLLGFCAIEVLHGFAWSMVGPFFILYAFDVISVSPVEWGLISTIAGIIPFCLHLIGGRLADRYSKRWLILVYHFSDVPAIVAFLYSRSYLHVLLLWTAWDVVGTLTTHAISALQTDLTPREQRGKVSSLLGLLRTSFGFLGSIIGGYLYGLVPTFPFWAYVPFIILVTVVAYQSIHEPEKPEK